MAQFHGMEIESSKLKILALVSNDIDFKFLGKFSKLGLHIILDPKLESWIRLWEKQYQNRGESHIQWSIYRLVNVCFDNKYQGTSWERWKGLCRPRRGWDWPCSSTLPTWTARTRSQRCRRWRPPSSAAFSLSRVWLFFSLSHQR